MCPTADKLAQQSPRPFKGFSRDSNGGSLFSPRPIPQKIKNSSIFVNAFRRNGSMPFNVGDSVYVLSSDAIRRGQMARVEQVLPKKLSVQDFQEYVVEFPDAASEQFRFCLYREFELSIASKSAF
jgi:hypothetical protein